MDLCLCMVQSDVEHQYGYTGKQEEIVEHTFWTPRLIEVYIHWREWNHGRAIMRTKVRKIRHLAERVGDNDWFFS